MVGIPGEAEAVEVARWVEEGREVDITLLLPAPGGGTTGR